MIFFTLFLACGSEEPEVQQKPVTEVKKEAPPSPKPPKPPEVKKEKPASSECAQLLKEYDGFVTTYISMIEKVSKGDVSAMSSYMDVMKKAEESSKKLDALQKKNGELDADCFKKYNQNDYTAEVTLTLDHSPWVTRVCLSAIRKTTFVWGEAKRQHKEVRMVEL